VERRPFRVGGRLVVDPAKRVLGVTLDRGRICRSRRVDEVGMHAHLSRAKISDLVFVRERRTTVRFIVGILEYRYALNL
jgi:hypothetical protein